MPELRYLDGPAVRGAVTVAQCADALTATLRHPFAGEDPPRITVSSAHGELLVMPSGKTGFPTTKLVTVANPGVPGPRIKGVHVVFDPVTMAPAAILDAEVLTLLRTAAVSVTALRAISPPSASRLVIFGSGPQAQEHADAIIREWPISDVALISREPSRGEALAASLSARHPTVAFAHATPAMQSALLQGADIVVCATSATEAVFVDNPDLSPAVVAIGSHRPVDRELPAALLARSFLCVEDRASALREAGDILRAIDDGELTAESIDADLGQLVRGDVTPPGVGPWVFKSVGMGWEDAVVGARIAGLTIQGDS